MLTAANCGLPTAEVFYEPLTRSCIVRRFDRISRPDGSLGRLVQYDLCQLARIVSERKYEKEGGPGIAKCAELIRSYSTQPAVDLRKLVAWIFFNLYAGNDDSHAKNLSIYHLPGHGVTLTPFYDLMCSRIYPGLSRECAFSIGGETRPGSVGRANVTSMAKELGMRPEFLLRMSHDLANRMPAAIDQALEAVAPSLPRASRTLAERLARFMLSTTEKTARRLAA